MRIAIIGTGKTASGTLLHLLAGLNNDELLVIARNNDKALAMILDAASAYPEAAQRVSIGSIADIQTCDILLFCTGSANDGLTENAAILRDYLIGGIAEHTRLVVIGKPVDKLTAIVGHAGIVDKQRLIGFGGDLDTARLHYVLGKKGLSQSGPELCLGEHGPRTIPVYTSEKDYEAVASEVRNLLKSITQKAGFTRNLATGVWLSRLALALTQPSGQQHVVCSFIEEYGLYLTWPRLVSSDGVVLVSPVERGINAERELSSLVAQKQSEQQDLKALAHDLFH